MPSATTQSDPATSGGATCTLSLPIVDAPEPNQGSDLLACLLREQQTLSAVELFSREHDDGLPAQSKYYEKLLPASPPGEGQQYAFEVDLDRCSGCKACVAACHSLNGLDEHETWRDVGLLVGGTTSHPVMQHVTTACHHCIDPGCMSACPVDAYEKDPATGIVRHLDDQCFGCQYCTLACPYDVPKYHAEKGIVRKCDMCADRLAVGEAPACVQACPHEAIAIRVVDIGEVLENSEADNFLPAAPEPHITLPTTSYRSSRVFPRNMLPADYYSVNPQHPHWPLIIMLVLTQLSVGAFAAGQWLNLRTGAETSDAMRSIHAGNALLFGLLALGASLFHLGRPQYAWRAFIGLKHSWLSREILTFGLFAGLATLFAGAQAFDLLPGGIVTALGWGVVATGGAGVFCSVMIYVVTRREFWNIAATGSKFFLTSAVLGTSAALLTLALLTAVHPVEEVTALTRDLVPLLGRTLIGAAGCKLLLEASVFRHLLSRRVTPLKRTALLMAGPLSNHTLARFACGFLGGVVAPLLITSHLSGPNPSGEAVVLLLAFALQFVACVSGELLERFLFFAAVAAPRMPGAVRT